MNYWNRETIPGGIAGKIPEGIPVGIRMGMLGAIIDGIIGDKSVEPLEQLLEHP